LTQQKTEQLGITVLIVVEALEMVDRLLFHDEPGGVGLVLRRVDGVDKKVIAW